MMANSVATMNTTRWAVIACVLLALTTIGPAVAVEVTDLYRADVPVNSQSQQERTLALRDAFSQVLVKVTGDDEVLGADRVKEAFRSVNDYLVQYTYSSRNERLRLRATFDESKVLQLLRGVDAVIWGQRRPTLMLWLAQETNLGERSILTSVDESVFAQQIRNNSEQRGVPISLPLMDLQDSMAVNSSDIWGRFNRPLIVASRRYDSDGVISTRVYRETNDEKQSIWVADWAIAIGRERIRGRTEETDIALLPEPLFADISRELAARYGSRMSDDEASETVIRVVDLTSLADVLEVETFLRSLTMISDVELAAFGDGQAEFAISLRGDARQARQTIALDRRMQAVKRDPFAARSTVPEYRWLSR